MTEDTIGVMTEGLTERMEKVAERIMKRGVIPIRDDTTEMITEEGATCAEAITTGMVIEDEKPTLDEDTITEAIAIEESTILGEDTEIAVTQRRTVPHHCPRVTTCTKRCDDESERTSRRRRNKT
jgi:hypothetical protein